MISWITILLFFLYFWGLGYTALYFLRKPEHAGERQLLYVAIGLGIFPILAILLNFLHIPLDWKIFLGLSLIFPVAVIIKKIYLKEFKFPSFHFKPQLSKASLCLGAVLIIFAFSLFMYTKGAFSYPYLEDEDPWGHSVGAKYVALEKSAYDPILSGAEGANGIDQSLSYIDPYPPAYDILMGILHQTSADLQWTLKFFNAFIISLGFIFFYLFTKELIGNQTKAVLATFIFASIPSYLSHFIWAHALAVTLFFPTIYALLTIKHDKRWAIVAGILIASIWVSQNIDQPLKMTTMIVIFLIVYSVAMKKFQKERFLAVLGGIILSLLWWGVMIKKYTLSGIIHYFGANVILAEGAVAGANSVTGANSSSGFLDLLFSIIRTGTNPGGSASRAYTFNDFFIARGENMINNPVGIGIVVSILILVGVGYLLWKYKQSLVTQENTWRSVVLFWLIFTFWGVNGITFPISVAKGAFRVWLLLAIPIALVAMEGFYALKNISKNKVFSFIIGVILILGILSTSAYQKYQLNTSIWPTSGSFTGGPMEPFEYGQWFGTIPLNTKVFLYSPRDKLAIGYGAFSCDWCQNVRDFRGNILSQNSDELHSFLKSEGYEYFIINPGMDSRFFNSQFGENKTKELLPKRYEEIINSGKFTPIYQGQNKMVVFKVI